MRLDEPGEFEVRVERMGDLVQASRNPENQKSSSVFYREPW